MHISFHQIGDDINILIAGLSLGFDQIDNPYNIIMIEEL